MKWQELMIDGYGRVLQILERALDGLTQEDLNEQPHTDCNNMGWLAWHLARVQDRHFANLMEEEQLWITDRWHTRFNRPLDPNDTGGRHTSEQVAAFQSPEVATLLEYYRTVYNRTKRYISSLSETDLDRQLNEPQYQPLPTVGVRIVSVLCDNLQHVGQVAYLRGLLKGKGWM